MVPTRQASRQDKGGCLAAAEAAHRTDVTGANSGLNKELIMSIPCITLDGLGRRQ